MPSFSRPFVTAGVALVGASVIAVSPVTPSQLQIRTVGMDVNLVAASTGDLCEGVVGRLCEAAASEQESIPFTAKNVAAAPSMFNIPANLFIALANVPYNFFNALGQGDVNLGDLPDSGFSFVNSREGVDLDQTEVVGRRRTSSTAVAGGCITPSTSWAPIQPTSPATSRWSTCCCHSRPSRRAW